MKNISKKIGQCVWKAWALPGECLSFQEMEYDCLVLKRRRYQLWNRDWESLLRNWGGCESLYWWLAVIELVGQVKERETMGASGLCECVGWVGVVRLQKLPMSNCQSSNISNNPVWTTQKTEKKKKVYESVKSLPTRS